MVYFYQCSQASSQACLYIRHIFSLFSFSFFGWGNTLRTPGFALKTDLAGSEVYMGCQVSNEPRSAISKVNTLPTILLLQPLSGTFFKIKKIKLLWFTILCLIKFQVYNVPIVIPSPVSVHLLLTNASSSSLATQLAFMAATFFFFFYFFLVPGHT